MKNKMRVIFYILLAVLVAFIFASRSFAVKERKIETFNFDTVCEISVYASSDKPLKDAKRMLDKFDSMWSANIKDSEIYRLNNNEKFKISEETQDIINYSKSFEREDLFNIYINSLVDVWDIKNNSGEIPDVNSALNDMNNKDGINLGGVAKGYACDKLVEKMREDGIESALISLGGNVFALGNKPTGENWRIGIADPKKPDDIIGSIRAENLAIVTSGDYQRFFEKDSVRYHHIFDPETGFPVNNGIRSCTIISESATLCDVLSTMVFVAGIEEGTKLLKEYNVGGIIITDDTVYFSKELEHIFKQSNFDYKYEFLF